MANFRLLGFHVACLALCTCSLAASALGQFPQPTEEHALLKKDVGTWKATIKMWMGPDGQADASAAPSESQGEEVNRMLGEFWCVSTFQGEFGGMKFEGHSVNGYDAKQKKFVGSWVDSISSNPMHMSGTYDAKTKTLTSESTSIGADGKEMKGKSTLVYQDDDHRLLTMYEIRDGKEVKSMEITYVRK
jgi:hypothetical protein